MKNKSYMWDKVKIFKLPVIKDCIDPMSLGFSKKRRIMEESDLVYALILTFHPSVIADFELIINKIKLKQFYSYPKRRNIRFLEQFFKHVPDSIKKALKIEVLGLLKKYGLSSNWLFPLMIKGLTDVLPVPPHNFPIEFVPDTSIKEEFSAIVIRETITKTAFIDWINREWEEVIYPKINKLPKVKFSKTSSSALALGLVFDLMGGKNKDWNKLEEFISKVDEANEPFFNFGENTPTRDDLQKLIAASKKALNDFFPLKSE